MSNDWLLNAPGWRKEYGNRIGPIIEYYAIDIRPDDYDGGALGQGEWQMIVEKMERLVEENTALRAELNKVSTTDTADAVDLEAITNGLEYMDDPGTWFIPSGDMKALIDGFKAQRAETQRLRGVLRKEHTT